MQGSTVVILLNICAKNPPHRQAAEPLAVMLRDTTKYDRIRKYIKSYFGVVNADDLTTIVSLFSLTTIKKGDFLLKSGRRCDNLSFVQSGLLRMFITTDEKEITQWISTKGYFSTDLSSFIFETPSRLSIQALTDTEVYSITKADYKKIGDISA
ncbi:cyclic nucleotide-binding domain-containing protein [Riemerella anatipestifer]|nr:cyclic nucleotide-binding domain-containing protein [Riemerella anatipestifer]MDY3534224.1 cyclic nucleotide-binding domain-containing protein [Riemerella anatipestifer]MDY3536273.1 cyclic nucleotide-binding domain-containing protein [Riemerella anatipestifer]